MNKIFNTCKKLEKIELGAKNINDMSSMFEHCEILKQLDLSKLSSENVIDIKYCKNLKKIFSFKYSKC